MNNIKYNSRFYLFSTFLQKILGKRPFVRRPFVRFLYSNFVKQIFGYVSFYGYLCITYISPGEALFRRQYVIILNPTHYNKTDK